MLTNSLDCVRDYDWRRSRRSFDDTRVSIQTQKGRSTSIPGSFLPYIHANSTAVPILEGKTILISLVLKRLTYMQENCWFLSSLIAGLLVRLGDGVFEFGRLVYPNIAPELRRYLYLRYLVETNASLDSLTVHT